MDCSPLDSSVHGVFQARIMEWLPLLIPGDLLPFFFFRIYFLYFTVSYWFCHTSTWICHGCTCVPHPEPPSHLPPCTIPLGHPSAPAPSFQYRASNLDWPPISYMILYMFQCHSPKSCMWLWMTSNSSEDWTQVRVHTLGSKIWINHEKFIQSSPTGRFEGGQFQNWKENTHLPLHLTYRNQARLEMRSQTMAWHSS